MSITEITLAPIASMGATDLLNHLLYLNDRCKANNSTIEMLDRRDSAKREVLYRLRRYENG